MTTFLRLLAEGDKGAALREVCSRQRAECRGQNAEGRGQNAVGERGDPRVFEVAPEAFDAVPGKPFAYWVSDVLRETFARLSAFESKGRTARRGPSTCDDFRYLRLWWEVDITKAHRHGEWRGFSKGGAFSRYYADIYLIVDWEPRRATFLGFFGRPGREIERPESVDCFFRPGLTWPLRTTSGLSLRAMPAGCIFGHKGPAAFVAQDDPDELLALLALTNSRAFGLLVSLQLAAADTAARSYEVGVIQKTPVPPLPSAIRLPLATKARRAWSLKRNLDTTTETSHAFLLPAALRPCLGDFDPPAVEAELSRIQAEIDAIAFDLYGFEEGSRQYAEGSRQMAEGGIGDNESDDGDDALPSANCLLPSSPLPALLSWSVGVAFGRFDWRLATGERDAPPDPDPFDPLPAKSPGMLPDSARPFHVHPGILVDDQGHPHDLAHLVEEVLEAVGSRQKAEGGNNLSALCPDVRRWLQRDFFPFHLRHYSKSRRKAPIYWPLPTASGRYTLWVYYPSLSSQTLYTAVNDFVEPKLMQVGAEIRRLKAEGSRQKDGGSDLPTAYRLLPSLQDFELELIELRDTLLRIAPTYKPNHDDGVQITAAPLWSLFRHKPWQKVLKDTWAKLEKGDYDWAQMAMSYWPERVRETCKTDKSLAIAHGLDDLYVEPAVKAKKVRGKK